MKFGSLFTGVGGFDLGFEQAGLTSEWQVELDADCNRVLEKHWPGVTRYKDVRDVGKLEPVDVICGGFPCQDLSVAGKRAGLAGERSGLWFEFLRIVELTRPRFVVVENVPGLLSSDEGRDFAVILRGLVECGYCLAWRIVDAQFYRVAQRRRRVFIVGSLGDGSSAEILFESESVSWNPPTRREAGQRVARAVTTGTGKSSGPRNGNGEPLHLITSARMTPFGEYVEDDSASSLKQRDFKDATDLVVSMPLKAKANSSHDDSHETYVTAYRTAGNCGPFDQGDRVAALNTATDPNQNIIAFSSKDHGADAGEIAPTLRSQNFKDSHMNGGRQVAIAFTERTRADGRNFESQEELAYAVTNPGSGGRTHSRQVAGQFGVRRLTPRECERLQGFPDDWTRWDANGKEISDSSRYRMLGNAVCVNVARWISSRLKVVGE